MHLPDSKENITVDSPFCQLIIIKKNSNVNKVCYKVLTKLLATVLQERENSWISVEYDPPLLIHVEGVWCKATKAGLQPDLPRAGSCLWVDQPVVVLTFCRAHGFTLGRSQRSAAAAGTLPV